MKKIFSLIFSLMLLLLGSCTKDEVLMTASISGYVTDYVNANAPIAGATVTINTKGITKTTGSDGRYEFTDVEPGTYTLQVTANGYQATTKQTTVYAGEVTNLDFQLSPAGQNVEVTPQMLSFGPQSKSLNFSIKNKGNASLQYSITNYPSYITVSPASGSVSAKGTQTVTVNVNRDALTGDATCQLLVNIGNDSYPVNISINSQEVTQKLTVTPALLDFGTAYNELQFTVKNIGTAGRTVGQDQIGRIYIEIFLLFGLRTCRHCHYGSNHHQKIFFHNNFILKSVWLIHVVQDRRQFHPSFCG